MASATERPLLLALFDLDGFKSYNDSFGHPAGDALLVRLGARLRDATATVGSAYRMGGDEFCVLAPLRRRRGPAAILDRGQERLSEHGEGFSIRASFGAIVLPAESSDAAAAMRAADQRMYANKRVRAHFRRPPDHRRRSSGCWPSATLSSATTWTA